MAGLDWVIIALYFAMLLGVAWGGARRKPDTTDDYFLAGRNLGWFLVGASIFASNIGSEHVVGLAGAGATSGVALAHYELHAWCLLVLGWVFVPFYSRALVYTMPEVLGRRFSPTARWGLSVIPLAAHAPTQSAAARPCAPSSPWGPSRAGSSSPPCCPMWPCGGGGPRSTASGSARSPWCCSRGCTPCSAACGPWPTPTRWKR